MLTVLWFYFLKVWKVVMKMKDPTVSVHELFFQKYLEHDIVSQIFCRVQNYLKLNDTLSRRFFFKGWVTLNLEFKVNRYSLILSKDKNIGKHDEKMSQGKRIYIFPWSRLLIKLNLEFNWRYSCFENRDWQDWELAHYLCLYLLRTTSAVRMPG